jgi:hypothetical protein
VYTLAGDVCSGPPTPSQLLVARGDGVGASVEWEQGSNRVVRAYGGGKALLLECAWSQPEGTMRLEIEASKMPPLRLRSKSSSSSPSSSPKAAKKSSGTTSSSGGAAAAASAAADAPRSPSAASSSSSSNGSGAGASSAAPPSTTGPQGGRTAVPPVQVRALGDEGKEPTGGRSELEP